MGRERRTDHLFEITHRRNFISVIESAVHLSSDREEWLFFSYCGNNG